MTQKTTTKKLSAAIRRIAKEFKQRTLACDQYVAIARPAIAESADRLDELAGISLEMLAMLPHNAVPTGCPACAIGERLKALGVERDTR